MKPKLKKLRHSSSHILAAAVKELYPEAKLGIGPAIKYGFYYDFEFPQPPKEKDLEKIQAKMFELAKQDLKFIRSEISVSEAKKLFAGEPYKLELIENLAKNQSKISIYKSGKFIDLCEGPHIISSKKINFKALKLDRLAGAYWLGSEKNPMLSRIYGLLFEKEKSLQKYLKLQTEAKERDHKKLGKELELFSLHNDAPGSVFWLPGGLTLKNTLINFWRKEHKKNGYLEISTPLLLAKKLWEKSGHWDYYRENMYISKIEKKQFAVKPMNCPAHMLVYKEKIYSYKDLPLRLSELGLVHRHEKSGTLNGLFRVRSFTQDDAHIFVTPKQLKKEIIRVVNLIDYFYQTFSLPYHLELSTRPKKSIGTDKEWQESTNALKMALAELKLGYKINEGDGAFYGPKIDFHISDALERTWQCATIQLDMNLPNRFNLTFINKEGKKQRLIMLHRVIYGCLERFIGILIEHYKGAFPLWLAPIQVTILPVSTEKHLGYAKEVTDRLEKAGIRAFLNKANESIPKKIREAEKKKIPYIVVVGDKEEKDKKVAVRKRGLNKIKTRLLSQFIEKLTIRIKEKR